MFLPSKANHVSGKAGLAQTAMIGRTGKPLNTKRASDFYVHTPLPFHSSPQPEHKPNIYKLLGIAISIFLPHPA